MHRWDGKAWRINSGWYTANDPYFDVLVQDVSMKYASERKLVPRNCAPASDSTSR